jgi:hypothetical protein
MRLLHCSPLFFIHRTGEKQVIKSFDLRANISKFKHQKEQTSTNTTTNLLKA